VYTSAEHGRMTYMYMRIIISVLFWIAVIWSSHLWQGQHHCIILIRQLTFSQIR